MLLVTGGTGFIGSVLVAELEARGFGPLVVADRLGADAKWRNIAKRALHDIIAPEAASAFVARRSADVEAVFHLGAISDTTETDGDAIVAANLRSSLDLWGACAEKRVPFFYASSAATYGDGTAGFEDEDSMVALSKLNPLNLYGWSKHAVDRRFAADRDAGRPTPPRWCGFKFFNVFGPNEYHKGAMRSVVAKAYQDIAAGQPLRLFASDRPDIADGEQKRDFVHVDDVVDTMIAAWQHSLPDGIYNLGSGEARSFLDLGNAVFAAMGRDPRIEFVPMPRSIAGRYQYFTQATMDRLDRHLPRNRRPLEETVRHYVQTFLAADDPYR